MEERRRARVLAEPADLLGTSRATAPPLDGAPGHADNPEGSATALHERQRRWLRELARFEERAGSLEASRARQP